MVALVDMSRVKFPETLALRSHTDPPQVVSLGSLKFYSHSLWMAYLGGDGGRQTFRVSI